MKTIQIHPGKIAGMILLWVALLLPLSACTRQEGREISDAAINSFVVGKTTEKDVIQKLGPPEKKKKLFGEEVWIYRHVVNKGFAERATIIHNVRLRFDNRGILQFIDQTKRKYKSLF